MTPPEHDRRITDVSRLRFTPQMVVMIVSMTLGVAGGMWASTTGLRSDMRDILTRMDGQTKVAEINAKLQEERSQALRESIEAMKRRQELQQYEIQGLKEIVLTLKGRL
jgi:hypothetical protein